MGICTGYLSEIINLLKTGSGNINNLVVKESIHASDLLNNVYTGNIRYGIIIWNKGTTELTFTINGITVTVAPSGSYGNEFDAFTSVTFSAGASFEAHLLGVRS